MSKIIGPQLKNIPFEENNNRDNAALWAIRLIRLCHAMHSSAPTVFSMRPWLPLKTISPEYSASMIAQLSPDCMLVSATKEK